MVKLFVALMAMLLWCGVAIATELRHNPFEKPPSTVETPSPGMNSQATVRTSLSLGGVVLAGSSSVATVNGQIYRLGKTINGMRLEAVDEDGATFIRNGVRIRLELEEPELDDSNE
ncbi:MAG: hypothetical protein AAF438_02965 [Pseudomonadota bacterium]